jgi:phosphatidylserine/phosphatidylglycerophosphate/cardiolipin synthase-like enzyme
MADINALKNAFFVNVGDLVQAASSPSDPDIAITAANRPQTEGGCRATYLIDGENYFGALKSEIASLLAGGTDRFFYTNSWHLGTSRTPDTVVQIAEGTLTSAWKANANDIISQPAFEIQAAGGTPSHPFIEDIGQMVAAGVDVRLSVWASTFLVNFKEAERDFEQLWEINVHSLQSALDIRQLPGMADKVVLNVLAHTLSAMHIKMVVCGDSTGFRGYVSGIDFVQNRNAPPTHPAARFWHDVALKVEGRGADGLYRLFEQLWNEQVQRSAKTFKAFGYEIKSHVDDTPLIDARTTVPIAGAQHHVQILRTLPTMNFSFFETDRVPVDCFKRLISGFKQKKLSFAEEGIFEFRAAQRKAVNAAQNYIYIEDQAFWNLELAGWINARLNAIAALKVILVHQVDKADKSSPLLAELVDTLIDGVPNPADRLAVAITPYTMHSKLTIIDDKWAVIGSSNCIRRSFYMEGEISVSVLDGTESVLDGTEPSFSAKFRKDLWGEHCGVQPGSDSDPLLTLNEALGIWRPAWGTPPVGFQLRSDIRLKAVPFIYMPDPVSKEAFKAPKPSKMSDAQRSVFDGDSRFEY